MPRLPKLLGFTALSLTAALLLSGCTQSAPATSDKVQVAKSAENLFNGIFHTSISNAKKVLVLDSKYASKNAKMNKADFIKQEEAYIPGLKEIQHTGQRQSDVADAEYALTALTMPAVESADPSKLKTLVYHVDATKVKLATDAKTATVAPDAFSVTLAGQKIAAPATSGSLLHFIKTAGRWGLVPKGLSA